MPLKLLKRTSKQYNVVSKTTFVISVELLDNGTMECTLDADSSGKDCLLNISQRLGLHQPEFFGLRYISRGVPPRQRWVELEKPLKKQLEKHAQDSQLSLGVMFYVADVNLLKDEMARYHYFLQLKSDVIDGKLNCNIDQAISLAAYSLQAEFGDYDPERHTIEYLRDFAILPKELSSESKYTDINLDALHEAVARQYGSLVGFPPPLAEIYYIMVAQQLDGYGQEAYPAKDDAGNDILICVSLNGLVIRRRDWTHVGVFRWSDIKSLIGHKRLFVVEKAQSQRTMQFHFTDPEVAKYVRKMCILQSTFCKQHLQNESVETSHRGQSYIATQGDTPDGSAHLGFMGNMRSTPDLIAPSLAVHHSGSQYSLNNNCFTPHSSSNLSSSGYSLHLLQNQQSTSTQASTGSQNLPINANTQQFHHSLQELPLTRSFTPSTNMLPATTTSDVQHHSLTGHNLNVNVNLTPSTDDLQTIQSLLPSYRPAPDYETAVQLKYGVNSNQLYFEGQSTSTSEDEPIYQNEIVSQIHSIELRDSLPKSQNIRIESGGNTTQNQTAGVQQTQVEDQHVYMYKPPPPYPGPKVDNPPQGNTLTPPIKTSRNQTPSPKEGKNASALSTSTTSVSSNTVNGVTSTTNSTAAASNLLEKQGSSSSNVAQPQASPSPSASYTANSARSSSASITSKTTLGKKQFNVSAASVSSSLSSATNSGSSLQGKYSKNVGRKDGLPHKQHQRHSGLDADKNKERKLYGKPIDANILEEYQGISRAKSNPVFTVALKKENSKRNRCPNILPYEDNLIRLNPSRQNPSGYINASPVSAHLSGRDWKYIVGQIPLAGYAPAVWQMIWETEAKIIAVLERDSTAPFYPPDSTSPFTFNEFQIAENKERSNSATIAREFTLTYTPKKKQRKVWILPYEEEWKDDVPIHTEHFLCFLEEVNSIQRKVSDPSTPLVVFCGTGAGRSGVLILSDLLLHAADSGHKVRCDNLLEELRRQRMMMVSSASQYAFVLHTLAKYLAQSRLI